MKNIIKKEGWSFVLLCLLLVMNHRFGYITLVGVFEILVIAIGIQSMIKMDNKGLCLLMYCIFYVLFSTLNGFSYSLSALVIYFLAPPIFYYYGKRIVHFCKSGNDFLLVWFLIILCYAIDTVIIGIDEMVSSGEWFASQRALSFYEGATTSATVIGLPLNIGMIGLPIAMVISNKRLKLPYFLLTVFSALVVTYLINRTGWVILFTCFCSLVMVKGIKNKRFLITSTLLIIIGGWLLISCTDILNSEMINLYNARNEEQGLEARSSRWIEHISNLMIHPFGWAEYGEVYYIHNMWLDVARISGLFPFLLLSGLSLHFLIMSFRNTLKYRTDSWMLIFGLNICFFASCFVEPIFGGTHFMVYCLLWGCQSTLDWKYKQKYVKSAK